MMRKDLLNTIRRDDQQLAASMRQKLSSASFGMLEGHNLNGDDLLYTCGLSWKQQPDGTHFPELIMPGHENVWAAKWICDSLTLLELPVPTAPVLLRHPDLADDLWLAPLQARLTSGLMRITQMLRAEDFPGQPPRVLGALLCPRGEKPRGWLTRTWSDPVPRHPAICEMPLPRNSPDPTAWFGPDTPPSRIPARLMLRGEDEQAGQLAARLTDHFQRVMAAVGHNLGNDNVVYDDDPQGLTYYHGALQLRLSMVDGAALLPPRLRSAHRDFGQKSVSLTPDELRAMILTCRLVTGAWPSSADQQVLDLCDEAQINLDLPNGEFWSLVTDDLPVITGPNGTPWNPAVPMDISPLSSGHDSATKGNRT